MNDLTQRKRDVSLVLFSTAVVIVGVSPSVAVGECMKGNLLPSRVLVSWLPRPLVSSPFGGIRVDAD
jgi:hypothetical protein